MGWWEGVRRRLAGPADTPSAAPSAPSGPEPAGASSSVPGDWDGGWRRVTPATLTVARAPLGVSDGLAFRSGLASWQNPTFDTGLGHGLLSSAPAGLVHGVTRPPVQRSAYEGGGPLLLRSLPEHGTEEAGDGGGAAPPSGSGPAPVQRVARAGGRGPGQARRSPAASETAERAGLVTGPELPVVRRVAVVPHAPAAGAAPRTTGAERAGAEVVRPRPLGPPLTVARRVTAGPVRRVAALRPEPATGAVQRASAPARPAGRTPLGAPLSELPSTAAPLATDGPTRSVTAEVRPSSGPALPVVRQAAPDSPAEAAVAARVSPATGPLSPVVQREAGTADVRPTRPLPPAVRPGADASDARTTSGPLLPDVPRRVDATGSAAADGPGVVRAAAAESRPTADPVLPVVQRAPDATGSELPAAGAPGTPRAAAADAPATARPLLPGVQRRVDAAGTAGHETPARPATDAPAASPAPGTPHTTGPALPVVQRQADASGSAAPAVQAPTGPLLPGVQRRTDAPGTGHEAPAPTAAHAPDASPTTGPALPVVQRQADASGSTPGDARRTPGPVVPVERRQAAAPGTEAPLLSPTRRRVDAAGSADGELPATAHRSAAAEPTTGPVLPVVQRRPDASGQPGSAAVPAARSGAGAAAAEGPAPSRRAERTGSSAARARGGLGAPLPSLPPTATPRGPAETGGRPAPSPVQRAVARPGTDAGPVPTSTAPLLGAAGTAGSPGPAPVSPPVSPPAGGPAQATPLVTRPGARPDTPATDAPGVVQRTTAAPGRPAPRGGNGTSPVVTARAVAAPRRPTTTAALSLLSARPLTPHTRAPEGMPRAGAPAAPAGPPVVAASWRRDPAPEARPATPRSPQAQQTLVARPGLPVVRPDTPVQRAATGAALPLTEAQAPPIQASPAPPDAPAGLPVPVVRATRPAEPDPVLSGAVPVEFVQRDAKNAKNAKAPAGGRPRSASAPPSFPAPATTADRRQTAPQDPGVDLEDLARRLLDPLARLLRADMRRGRERAGRPYDGRR
ncbi:hypothetical protein ACL07V_28370 [Streptomyces sp. MB22_4]|uniref:hypothetical protein n=1 Tax=Streptomyces sp. MB22_4 TaxID=3383120 RepID=UPI00399FA866